MPCPAEAGAGVKLGIYKLYNEVASTSEIYQIIIGRSREIAMRHAHVEAYTRCSYVAFVRLAHAEVLSTYRVPGALSSSRAFASEIVTYSTSAVCTSAHRLCNMCVRPVET